MPLLARVVFALSASQVVVPGPMATPPGWMKETLRAEALIERGQHLEAAGIYERYSAGQPWFPAAHYLRIGALLDAGQTGMVPQALAAARTAIPRTAALRCEAAMFVLDLADRRQSLPREQTARLIDEAHALVDDALAVEPTFTEALTRKASILLLQAERLERDPARKAALEQQATDLYEKAFQPPKP